MKKMGDFLEFSATDLVGYLNCRHLAVLDRAVAEGALAKPKIWNDPLLEILSERGAAHEKNYVEHLTKAGLEVVRIDGADITNGSVGATLAAMQRGVPVIAQAALSHESWNGRADILRRIEVPSALGSWSYEPIDTKLARETKSGAILQLCLYCDLLAESQKFAPEYMYVVAPWSDFVPQQYRFANYAAYFRKVKRSLLKAMLESPTQETYPDPIEHCEVCRWREACDKA
jgi:predicted RecB family nuclease